jgi:adenosylhomocysteine nucleosidase
LTKQRSPEALTKCMKDLIVIALEAEAPSLYKEYANVHVIGVGKVNSAINTMKLINQYKPTRVINLGTAGGITVDTGCYRINNVWQHDVNLSALGLEPGIHQNDRDSLIVIPGPGKTCASGDLFVTEPNKLRVQCDIVEMEAYSVAKSAKACGIDVEIWKYISDKADAAAGKTWQESVANGEKLYREVLKDLEVELESR